MKLWRYNQLKRKKLKMNLDNLNFTNIEESTLTVSYPFQYDREKVLKIDAKNIVKLNPDYLSDFLPYTKNNFFGKYHFRSIFRSYP